MRLCYEAGGEYVPQRWLEAEGARCEAIAPPRVPCMPSVAEERARAVMRLHDELTRDMTRTKNRLPKHLARLGLRYEGGCNWTRQHRRWLARLELAADEALIPHSHLHTLEHLQAQLEAVDERIAALAQEEPYAQGAGRLMSLRGIGLYSAIVLLTEIGDI